MYEEVYRELQKSKSAAESRAYGDEQIAFSHPFYAALEKAGRRLCFELSENNLKQSATVKLKKELADNEQKKQAFLTAKGLLITPQYSCALCNDTGFADNKTCVCVKKRYSELMRQKMGLTSKIEAAFDACDFSLFGSARKQIETIYRKIQGEFCGKFPETNIRNIILSGANGTGKTHLAACIANDLLKKNFSVAFYTAFELNDLFLQAHTDFEADRAGILKALIDCDLLIIDDLGTEPTYKNITLEYLFMLINRRIIDKRHTIITTNLTIDKILERYGERIWSRLVSKDISAFLQMNCDNIRLRKPSAE